MKQSRRMSLTESITNVAVGYCIAIAAQYAIFPMFGIFVPFRAHLVIAGFFTVVSIARSYGLRRIFEELRLRKIWQ